MTQDIPTKAGPMPIGPSLRDRAYAIDLLGKYGGIEKITVENGTPIREPAESMMARVLTMVGRAMLSAPAPQRTALLQELTAIEATVAEP